MQRPVMPFVGLVRVADQFYSHARWHFTAPPLAQWTSADHYFFLRTK
jgi:hypothetical protein